MNNLPEHIKRLRSSPVTELQQICEQYRRQLIEDILAHGGHFSANLGTVEITIALHYVLDTPFDQLVWDVGHQAYLHKYLTGRADQFHTIRKKGGISGFPKRSESEFDDFGTGHSSTSISAVLGLAQADRINNIDRQHVAVIGDGSLTGGQAWEALNNAAVSESNVLIIINDNQMGIDPNAGALNHYLENLDLANNIFSQLGFEYHHSEDGHDVVNLVEQLKQINKSKKPRIWHIKTIKGKGYKPAEEEQTKWHAVKYVKISESVGSQKPGIKFQDVFGKTLVDLADRYENVVGITPAMPSGSSMKMLMDVYPERCFDVGIAEQHAVTFAAGLAANGMKAYCNVYSTFLQRGYDQVIHDICLQNLPVVLCLDRAGHVGEDGPTHHGLYDISFLRSVPNLEIWAPSDEYELRQMLYAAYHANGPVAIRYPRGKGTNSNWDVEFDKNWSIDPRMISSGKDALILSAGTMLEHTKSAVQLLDGKGISCELIDIKRVKPLPIDGIVTWGKQYSHIFCVEDGVIVGGFGSAISEILSGEATRVHILGFPDQIIEQSTRQEAFTEFGLDGAGIAQRVASVIRP